MDIYRAAGKCVKRNRKLGLAYEIHEDNRDELALFMFDLLIRMGELDYHIKAKKQSEREKIAIAVAQDCLENERYTVLLDVINKLIKNSKEHMLSIIIESNYAELVYRDSYYMYYAGKHYAHSRMCTRLFFFHGKVDSPNFGIPCCDDIKERFLGFMTLKPSANGVISRTIINPSAIIAHEENKMESIRTCKYDCTMYGTRLEISGFPYMMQDAETTTCAEVTILNLADYFSKKYPEYHLVMPSEIGRFVEKHIPERTLPAHGMSYANLTHVLKEIGFQPRLYASPDIDLKNVINYYVESAIPLAIGLFKKYGRKGDLGHSVICIGKQISNHDFYKKNVQQVLFEEDDKSILSVYLSDMADASGAYYIMDDNKTPYSVMSVQNRIRIENRAKRTELVAEKFYNEKDWIVSSVAAPLGKGMYLDAMGASDIVKRILASSIGITYAYSHLGEVARNDWGKVLTNEDNPDQVAGAIKGFPLIFRLFLATSRSFKKDRVENLTASAAMMYGELPMPQYVWVCELYTVSSYKKNLVVGEIVLDATASQHEHFQSIVLIHYPFTLHYRLPQQKYSQDYWKNSMKSPHYVEKWKPFKKFEFGNISSSM